MSTSERQATAPHRLGERRAQVAPSRTGEQQPIAPDRPWPRLVLGALLVASAAMSWERVFPAVPLLRAVTIAVLVPSALVAVGRRRVSLWLTLPVGAGAALALVPVAVPGVSVRALRTCWYDLLTTPPPVEPTLVIGVYSLVWCAAWATGEALTRSRRVLPALAFGFVVLVGGVALGAGDRGVSLVAAGCFAACALMLIAGRAAALGVPAVAAVAVLVAPTVTGGRPAYDPRRLVHPQAQHADVTDLLDQVPAWLAHPDTPLFHVAAPEAQNWRLAALDRFDGQSWSTADMFWPVTARLPGSEGADRADAAGTAAAPPSAHPFPQHVTIDALSGPWLPAAPTPTSLRASGLSGVLADPASESLLTRTPLQPGRTYEVTSQNPDPTASQLLAAVADPAAGPDTVLPPGLPQTIRDTAQQAVTGATSPFQQASRLERYLRDTAHNDPGTPPGHTYGHLAYFLGVSHRGTSEQFATAFAVMARSIGLPARIVVGFRPGTQTAPGVWQVSGADAFVWPEVDFASVGWVPFFPTPGASSSPDSAGPAEGQTPERAQLDRALDASQQPAAADATSAEPPAAASRPAAKAEHARTWPLWVGCAAAPPVGYLTAVLAVPSLRRRRSRRLPAAQSVHAAWRDTLRRLRWIGMTEVRALTNSEVADLAARRLGEASAIRLAPLAGLADAAAFADIGVDIGVNIGADTDIRASAWAHRDHLATLIRRHAGPRATLWHTLRPRAFRD